MTLFEIDPNVVKPGWIALIIIIVLAAVMVVLFFSMRRQFAKITAPYAAEMADESRESENLPVRNPDDRR